MGTASAGEASRTLALSNLYLLLGNLGSLAAAFWFSWTVFDLLVLFWAETVLIGVLAVLRLKTIAVRRNLPWVRSLTSGFMLFLGAFISAHLVGLVGIFWPKDNAWSPLTLVLPLIALSISHVHSYTSQFIGQREYRHLDPSGLALRPFSRVAVMHIALVVGGILALEMAEPLYALAVLVLMKIGFDTSASLREQRLRQPFVDPVVGGDWEDQRFLPPDSPDLSPEQAWPRASSDEAQTLAARFLERARPVLVKLRAERARMARVAWLVLVGVTLLGGVIGLGLGLGIHSVDGKLSLTLGLIAGAAMGSWMVMPGQVQWKQRVLDAALPEVCAEIGGIGHHAEIAPDAFLRAFERAGILGESGGKLEHYFCGRYRGLGFEFVDACIYFKPGKFFNRSSSDFVGLLYRIQLPMIIRRRVVIMPRRRLSLHNDTRALVRIELGDAVFDDRFEVHVEPGPSDDAASMAAILNPEARHALLALDQARGGEAGRIGRVHMALADDSLYLATWRLERHGKSNGAGYDLLGAFLELPLYLYRDVELEQRLARLADEIGEIHRIMDRLPWTRRAIEADSTGA